MTDDNIRERVCDKARKKLEENCRVDFVPGKNYISFKRSGVNFYAPNLIHTAETLHFRDNNGYFPLLVKDVLRTKDPRQLYRNEGTNAAKKHICFYSNHPLLNISITGKITYERTIEVTRKNQQGKEVTESIHILDVDDGSSEISVQVRVSHIQYAFNQMSYKGNRNILFRIDGHIAFYYLKQTMDLNQEIRADNIMPIGNRSEFQKEINWWRLALDARHRYLETPWVVHFGLQSNNSPNSMEDCTNITSDKDVLVLLSEKQFNQYSEKRGPSVLPKSIILLQMVFLRYMIRHYNAKTMELGNIITDTTMRKEILEILNKLSLHPSRIDITEIYRLVIGEFIESRMIKQKSVNEISVLKFSRLFCYIRNMIKFLTTSQEVEISRLIKKSPYMDMNRHTYKDIQKSLNQLVHFSINLEYLTKELSEKFNIRQMPLELTNTLIENLICGDYIAKGGIMVREFQGNSTFKIVIRWKSIPGKQIWKYVPKLYLS